MSRRLLIALATGSLVSPVDYGAECDVQQVYDAVVTGGALSTVTSASAGFTSGDTGKTYTLASTAGAVTTGTVTYVNSTTLTMSTAAGGAMTGARFIWGTDDTAAWQDALDAALPGQTVDIADANWRSLCAGQLSIPTKVQLGMTGRGPYDPQTNPAGNTWGPTFVVVQDATTPFISMAVQSGLGDFIFYSANQVPPTASTPIDYAAFVKVVNGGSHIGRPYFANAFRGIDVWSGRVHIDIVSIGCFVTGVRIDHAQDVVSINEIRAHPFWRICEGMAYTPTAGSLDEYAQDNARALRIQRADAFMVGSVFSFGLYGAVIAIDSADAQTGAECGYGTIETIDADNCVVGIDAWETNEPILIHSAFLGSNGTGVGTAGSAGIATHTGGSIAPRVVLKSWSHRGTWSTGASSTGAGTTLIVPSTNPG